jgi:hypothetical protein
VAQGGSADLLSPPRWEIAPEVSWFRYEEPGIMKDTGILYGFAASYTRYRQTDLLRLEGGFSTGLIDYEGSLTDGTPYTMEDCRDYLINVRGLWGRPWQAERWDHRFYAGFGYRYLNDDSTQDPAGYNRHSNYFYMPVGLKAYHELAGDWQIGLGGELDVLLLGIQISGISDGDSSYVTNFQGPGFGARLSVELRHKSTALDLAVAPFLQYWWIDDSSVSDDGWYEPRNSTLQYGLNLIWRF